MQPTSNNNHVPPRSQTYEEKREDPNEQESWLEFDSSQTFLSREALLAAIEREELKKKEAEKKKNEGL
jgi:hypothetical protein